MTTNSPSLRSVWIDDRREPQCPPDPRYPTGIDVDAVAWAGMDPATQSCRTELPYPAKRCGHYEVTCSLCDMRVIVTTAGRPDDPKSIRLPCKLNTVGKAS